MKFTNEQNQALNAKGRVLVSAAAGSGKTAVLVEKCVNLICDENNPVSVDKILVATFTVAAAAEMKARILKAINERLKKKPQSVYLRQQKLLLPSAKIGTIDSMCISLAREYFYQLGISPDFKIEDASAENRLKNATIDEVINKHFLNGDEEFLQLFTIFNSKKEEFGLKGFVFKFYDYLVSLPFPQDYCDKVMSIYENFDENSVIFDVAYDYYSDLLINKITIIENGYEALKSDEKLFEKYGPNFEEVKFKLNKALEFVNNKDYDSLYDMLQNYSNVRLNQAKGVDEVFKARMKSIKGDCEKAFAELKKVFYFSKQELILENEKIKPLIKKFIEITLEFSNLLFEKKVKNNRFSFSDIENIVLKLLVKKENGKITYSPVAQELSQKYYAVFADEYQDTNDLQNTIFEAISNGGKKLFMVGDVKQSIYRFRNANPKNFLNFRESLPDYKEGSESSRVIMSGNFRSHGDICSFANILFYRLFSKKCGEMDYFDVDKLVNKAEYKEVDMPRVSLDLIQQCSPDYSSSEHQAFHIAKIIKDMMNSEPCIYDSETKQLRKAKYSDFCVLIRNRTHFDTYGNVFESFSIPVRLDKERSLLDNPEIINIFSALQVVENPFLDIPLITLMLSDIYSFSTEEIAKIRAENKNVEFYRALLSYKEKSEKLKSFLEEIEEFRKFSINSSVLSLINKILIKTGYENTVFSYENGDEAYNNLIAFKNKAKDFENNNANGLAAFVNYIRALNKSGISTKNNPIDEKGDFVKVMTIHRSKGLQFPVCIVAELEAKFTTIDISSSLILSEKVGIGIKYYDKERKTKITTFSKNIAALEKKASLISEELRLLYVALTRAKDFLYLVGYKENANDGLNKVLQRATWSSHDRINPYYVRNCSCYLDMILPIALRHPCGKELRKNCEFRPKIIDCDDKLQTRVVKEIDFSVSEEQQEKEEKAFDENLYNKISENLQFSYKYKDLNKIFVKQSASALAHKEFASDYDYSNKPVFLQNQRLSASQKGTAMHKFMQFCDFAAAKKDVLAQAKALVEQGKLTTDEAKSLKIESLTAFLNSSLCEKIIKSEAVYKEQGFMVEIPANEIYDDLDEQFVGENIIIQGFADLCFADGDGIFIIDYKTDKADENELVKRYKKQLDVYEKALKLTFNKEITGKAIYSFYLNKIITL